MTPARLLAPFSFCLLAACAHQPRSVVTLDQQSECPLTLKTGQVLMLTLPSTPTTGYRWQIQNPAQGILRSMGPEVYSNPEDKNMVGSAGQSVWRYKASDAGTGHLMMVYQQPWAPEVAPERTFDCVITVNE
ncbi:MAG TPA: protease inhibitor I42 family protein [Pseudomonas sp.]|jgi:inhibitor of cysteine peptidase